MIIRIEPSPLKQKRFRAIFDSGRKIDFGYSGAKTYLDGVDASVRESYRKRHYGNATEKKLIDELIPSASLLSYYLTWGDSRDIEQNRKKLNQMWKKKENKS